MSNPILDYFSKFIETELGIVYSEPNYFQLDNRLKEIAKTLGLGSPQELYNRAVAEGITGDFRALLLDVATNNETSFFRDKKLFDALERTALPSIVKSRPELKLLRIWSVASSFGQEAYSIAMIIKKMQDADPRFPRVEIFGTDISDRALKRASEGKYMQLEVQRGLPMTLLVQNFNKLDDGQWQIKPELRSMARFQKMNLLNISGVIGKFDLILCRNVLIYQNAERKAKIVQQLLTYLHPNGLFVLGAAESLFGVIDGYQQKVIDGAMFYGLPDNQLDLAS